MQKLANSLELLATLTEEAETIANLLASLRLSQTEEEWEAIVNSPFGCLIDACVDLEYTYELIDS